MKVAVDLDGPCYEFARTVRYMLNNYRDRDLPPLEDFWHEWYPKEISSEDWDWVFTEGIKLGVFRYGHMTKDTRVGLERLVEMGHSIHIITNRPEEAVDDTREWVEFFYKDIPYALHILHGETPDKSMVDADLLIDDRPVNIEQWSKKERPALWYRAPWNKNDEVHVSSPVWSVWNWREVIRWFEARESAMLKTQASMAAGSLGVTTATK